MSINLKSSFGPSYGAFSTPGRPIAPLRNELEASLADSLTECKKYLKAYLDLVNVTDMTLDIMNAADYDRLIMSLLQLWSEYNKVFLRLVTKPTIFKTRFKKFGDDLTTADKPFDPSYNSKLVLFKKLAVYDDSLTEKKSKADIGIMNLITTALIDSKDNRTLFQTLDYEPPIIAEIICHFLRAFFDTYFRSDKYVRSVLFESEKRDNLLIRLDEIIKLNDEHICIHIHTGVGRILDGDRARFCKEIQIICKTMDNFGITYTRSKNVNKLCFPEEAAKEHKDVALEMDLLSPTIPAGGKSTRRRKSYKTTRRINKNKNKKQYRRKRRTKRCKKSHRRRRSRR